MARNEVYLKIERTAFKEDLCHDGPHSADQRELLSLSSITGPFHLAVFNLTMRVKSLLYLEALIINMYSMCSVKPFCIQSLVLFMHYP